ncbi:MAG: hypothetical protein L0Y71_20995 [Gemmataceae bacterium]|nr:hypothetical protein [Gemmataceae bacterium]
MSNRILDAYVATHRADPADAELRVIVRAECITPTTEIKGRLTGPRSPYASTVEIAYPYRELARSDHILLRVLIPEPSWWAPKTPLLYDGPLELWQDGELRERIQLRHGIRTVQLTPAGLRVNGKPCRLKGVCAESFTEDDARRWHDGGVNLVLVPARDEGMDLWKSADRFGLFVLGRVEQPHQWPRWALASQRFPSFLGCVLTATAPADRAAGPGLVGAELPTDDAPPQGRFDFLLGDATALAAAPSGVPRLLLGAEPAGDDSHAMLGWVQQA